MGPKILNKSETVRLVCQSSSNWNAWRKENDYAPLDLSGVCDFMGRVLCGADFRNVDLTGSSFEEAHCANCEFIDAKLVDADLRNTDFTNADLTNADLSGALLRGCCFTGATLDGTKFSGVPVVKQLDQRILAILESGRGELCMGDWHTCQTTHCRAGWAVMLAGEAGQILEQQLGAETAGTLIYAVSEGYVPDFFATEQATMEDLQARCATDKAAFLNSELGVPWDPADVTWADYDA